MKLSMTRIFYTLTMALLLIMSTKVSAQSFDDYFEDATLRLDYIFAGNAKEQRIYLEDLKRQDHWAGRRYNLSENFLEGNGQITVRDHATQKVIYTWAFSTLFQEWLHEEEAQSVDRAYESSYNIPYPKQEIDVTVTLTDNHKNVVAKMKHTVDPKDILIRHIGDNGIPYKYIWKATPAQVANIRDCIDIAILAEGYTAEEQEKFYHDCERAAEALFAWEPFKSMKERFNIVAVAAPSQQSGPSVPRQKQWKSTATSSHYDTFYSDRYLTTKNIHHIYDLLSGVPFEHIIVLVNSNVYGGGGIFNQLTVTTSDNPNFKPVLVHEFGHSYGGLADEYAYGNSYEIWYPSDVEPWEPNITTLHDFKSKWQDLMPKKTPIPTPLDPKVPDYRIMDFSNAKQMARLNAATQVVGVFEGAGYQTKGCYRPAQECRMKINEVEDFCPVCSRSLRGLTEYYTKEIR